MYNIMWLSVPLFKISCKSSATYSQTLYVHVAQKCVQLCDNLIAKETLYSTPVYTLFHYSTPQASASSISGGGSLNPRPTLPAIQCCRHAILKSWEWAYRDEAMVEACDHHPKY